MDDDIDSALEWAEYEASLCDGCRRSRVETMDPEMDEKYDAIALRCHACAARERVGKKFGKSEYADTAGLYIAIVDPDN